MKEKRNIKNIFQSVVFMLFTFFIFGVNNVSAQTVTVTATLPSGKSTSKTLILEEDLNATAGGTTFYSGTKDNGFVHDRNGTFTITTNMDVTWNASGAYDKNYSTYNGTTYKGKMINQGNGIAYFTVTSKGGQKIEMFCQFYGN